MSTKPIRPYLGLKKSFIDLFKNPSRYIRPSVSQESEFEKPYQTDDYRTMHYNVPQADWGPGININASTLGKTPSVKGSASFFGPTAGVPEVDIVTGSSCRFCTLICFSLGDCEQRVSCIPGTYCSYVPYFNPQTTQVHWAVQFAKGHGLDLRINQDWAIFPSLSLRVDPEITDHVFTVYFTDEMGHECFQIIEKTCSCNCDTADTFLFNDEATPDTIVKNSSIDVFTYGGCGPYTWADPGTGYSWAWTTSDEHYNTLTCVDGACGVDFATTAEVSITDACGDIVGTTIYNTAASWVSRCNSSTTGCPNVIYCYKYLSATIRIYIRGTPADCALSCKGCTWGTYYEVCGADCAGSYKIAYMKVEEFTCP